ncbi:MAG: HlyD family secretion protein [Gammaproteobacteria bacterium]|nr:HlyD family secretion protein [Gammaproteobacteria bacterium]
MLNYIDWLNYNLMRDSAMNKYLQKPYIILIIIGLSVLVAILLVKARVPLEHADTEMPSKSVEIIKAKRIPFAAKVVAYGNVEPTVTLKTLAEVSGKISYMHPDLNQGNSIAAGTVVARIDPQDYEVILRQTQADLAANKSSLKQLEVEHQTTSRSLELAKKNLLMEEKELDRIRTVWDRKLIARSALDAEEQKVIQLRQQVSELQGQLNTYASRKATVLAQISRTEEQMKGEKTTLGRTEITLPFSARISVVSIEKDQFVNVGSTLFEAQDIDSVEINAQLPIMHMRSLVSHLEGKTFDSPGIGLTREVLARLNLSARVKLVGDMPDAWWDAKVLRISESIDPIRRTLGIVVGVDRPYEKVIPGRRPPLLKGMFTAVELHAPQREAIVIPRKAIHHGRVYVVSEDKRLQIKAIEIQQQQGDLVVIRSGLQEGDQIIISDLVPVIEGMPLTPVVASEYEKALVRRASGTE